MDAQAEEENKLLIDIQKSVESLYHDGRPLHHQPNSQKREWDPKDHLQSSIFVTKYKEFKKLTPVDIQEIFCHRHILVLGCPLPSEQFSLEVLSEIACLNILQEVQGSSICPILPGSHCFSDISQRPAHAPQRCLHLCTLENFYAESQKRDNGRIINCLDLPIGWIDRNILESK
jgi:hypothetical protein